MIERELTRNESGDLNDDQSNLAERLAAEEYDYSTIRAEAFDAARETGAVLECKSTVTELENGRTGRFRLWEDQHERLLEADRDGTGRYVFVLFDVSTRPPVAKMKIVEPAEIGNTIGALGGFNESGHHQGPQKKLHPKYVFDE